MIDYVNNMNPVRIHRDSSRSNESLLVGSEMTQMRGVIGQLQWYTRLIGYEHTASVSRIAGNASRYTLSDHSSNQT